MNSAQRLVSTLGVLLLVLHMLTVPIMVYAQPLSATSLTSYIFRAKEGDSLSRIVRRALELRAISDQPTAMYCENLIANTLGGNKLAIDQEVVVTYAQIDACSLAAKALSVDERAAWQAYANTVDFAAGDLSPINNSSRVVPADSAQTTAPTTKAPPRSDTVQSTQSATTSTIYPPKANVKARPFKLTNNLWYLVAAIPLLYFILNGSKAKKRRTR